MGINLIRSEFLKFFSVKSHSFLLVIFFLISVGGAVASVFATKSSPELAMAFGAESANVALTIIGVPLIFAVSTLLVTSEYKTGYQQYTYSSTPHRWESATAKLMVSSVVSGVALGLTALIDMLVFTLFSEQTSSENVVMSDVWKISGMFLLSGVFIALITHGLGYLLRNTAGVVVILIVMYGGLENIFGIIPKVKDVMGSYFPLMNMSDMWRLAPNDDVGSLWGSAGVVLAWAIPLFIVGVVALSKRDA